MEWDLLPEGQTAVSKVPMFLQMWYDGQTDEIETLELCLIIGHTSSKYLADSTPHADDVPFQGY